MGKSKRKDRDAEEKHLESLLFGNEEEEEKEELPEPQEGDDAGSDADVAEEEPAPRKRAAWQDDDDDEVEINLSQSNRAKKLRKEDEEDPTLSGVDYVARLRDLRSNQTRGSSDWARPEEQDEENEGLRKLARKRGKVDSDGPKPLEPNVLHVKRLKDGNCTAPSKAVIQQVQYHSSLPMMLTAGYDKTLRLFLADGKSNTKLQSVFLEDLPIRRAHFIPETQSVVMTGRRPFYYVYDMGSGKAQRIPNCGSQHATKSLEDMCVSPVGSTPLMAFLGKDGYTFLSDSRTRRYVSSLKMNGSVRAGAFTHDGRQLITGGDEGALYIWDMRTHRCVSKMADDGALRTTCIECSTDGRYWAAGSDSGVVNIYDATNRSAQQQPIKAIMNLTTAVDNISFNHDSQLLAISSRFKKEALKMVHLESMTVYQNWPTSKTPLSTVSSIDFSPNSLYFGIANDAGKVLVYNLTDYYQSK